jgi:PhnB protein
MKIEPYLIFDGRAEEAIEFYKTALGATVNRLVRYKDSPQQHALPVPNSENKVMHASMTMGETEVFIADGHCGGNPVFEGITLSLTAADEAEAERTFAGLSDGGKVSMPIGKQYFAARFGMVTDRFGVAWMVIAH